MTRSHLGTAFFYFHMQIHLYQVFDFRNQDLLRYTPAPIRIKLST